MYIIYIIYNIVNVHKKMGVYWLERGFSLALTVG